MTSFNTSGVMGQIWGLLYSLLQTIMTGLGVIYNDALGGFGGGLNTAFQAWGNSLAQYGVWSLAMMVISIMIAIIIAYLFFMVIAPEKDMAQEEEEL